MRNDGGDRDRVIHRLIGDQGAWPRSSVEAARLLPAIDEDYCLPILHALLPLLQADAPPLSASAATYTLAELIPIAGPLLDPYASELLELFLAAMRPAAVALVMALDDAPS